MLIRTLPLPANNPNWTKSTLSSYKVLPNPPKLSQKIASDRYPDLANQKSKKITDK